MFNKDVLEAIALLREEIRSSKDYQRTKVRDLTKAIIEEIVYKEDKKLNKIEKLHKEKYFEYEKLKEREQLYREKYFEIASSLKGVNEVLETIAKRNTDTLDKMNLSFHKLQEELNSARFQLTQKQIEIEDLRIYEGKVNCILNNHVAFKDVSVPNASLTYKIKIIIDYFLTKESTNE